MSGDIGAERESIVVPEQRAISVYTNQFGDVVIRQINWPDEDACLRVPPQYAHALAQAILAEAGLTKDEPAPADRTNAVRQRRHRARRNGQNGGDRYDLPLLREAAE